ncbi:hypothetical protein NL676_002533 [Syzygium grande]|nr:hypothetical protein NL676_002533 [Syzygium grande]
MSHDAHVRGRRRGRELIHVKSSVWARGHRGRRSRVIKPGVNQSSAVFLITIDFFPRPRLKRKTTTEQNRDPPSPLRPSGRRQPVLDPLLPRPAHAAPTPYGSTDESQGQKQRSSTPRPRGPSAGRHVWFPNTTASRGSGTAREQTSSFVLRKLLRARLLLPHFISLSLAVAATASDSIAIGTHGCSKDFDNGGEAFFSDAVVV